jgi:arginine deiminase
VPAPPGVDVRTEYAQLRTVLVHEPGAEIGRLTPRSAARFLFANVPDLPRMKEEHRAFVALMAGQGVEVLRLGDLLSQTLGDEESRRRLVAHSCRAAGHPFLADLLLDEYSPAELQDILFGGLGAGEPRARRAAQLAPDGPAADQFLLPPIPNAYFSRDPAAVLNDQIVLGKMHHAARRREPLILKEVMRTHPRFAGTHLVYDDPDGGQGHTIEGGDILVINCKAVAVGCSERTCSRTIADLARRLFEAGRAERVYQFDIPSAPVYMHLDTVLTVLDEGLVVAYTDVMDELKAITRYEPDAARGPAGDEVCARVVDETRSFKSIFEAEFGHVEVVKTGNGDQRRAAWEQQARGTNVFATGPSTVIAYAHNTHTNEALAAAGVRVLRLEGAELVRGMGGPRCMAMPLRRQAETTGGCSTTRRRLRPPPGGGDGRGR